MNRTCLALILATGIATPLAYAATPGNVADPVSPALSILANPTDPGSVLGPVFENQSAGISLRVPAGLHRIRSSGAGDDIGEFGDEKRNWQLKLTRILRNQPTSLVTSTDNLDHPVPGLLDQSIARLKKDLPGGTVLRQDLTNIRDGDPAVKDNVGMLAIRYGAAGGHYLSQQAIIQANDRLFYLIALTSPGSDRKGPDSNNDPRERGAVEAFGQMLDSVRLLDTRKIAQDQRDRLIRTRALMVNWTAARVRAALVGEQWLRVLRDGKDVGYSYITEQTAAGVPRPLKLEEVRAGKSDRDLVQPGDGILIGIRARSVNPLLDATSADKPHKPVQIDTASWLFVRPDRQFEDWSRIIVADAGEVDKAGKPVKTESDEFGSSAKHIIRSLDKGGVPGTPTDKQQPPVSVREQYSLNVTGIDAMGASDPFTQDLPPFYLPQAFGHLLPRLLPLRAEIDPLTGSPKVRSYLFATYVPDAREVMLRYVDVGAEQQVTLNGRTLRAIPITDRFGWHGSVTTHYMSPDGAYLGSENKESHVIILPTDAQTLLSIWKNPDLTRPGGVNRPGRAPEPQSPDAARPQ